MLVYKARVAAESDIVKPGVAAWSDASVAAGSDVGV